MSGNGSRIQHRVEHWLPGVRMLRTYERRDLRHDVVAGLVLTGVLIPAGMGYAEAAGLPAVTGLYATITALVAYALVGPSRYLVLGPDSSLTPLILAAIAPLALADSERAIALAGLLAILMGLLLVAGGFLRLGFVMDLLSRPIRLGYLTGIALVISVSQLPKLFGFSTDADDFTDEISAFAEGLADGLTNTTSLALGLGSLAIIFLVRRLLPRVPALLVAVVAATLAVALFDLDVPVVGELPQGLPAPALDALEWGDVVSLLPAAIGIALVAFADTGVLSRTFALRRHEIVHESREMGAVGVTNIGCGLLGGFPVSASSSRTPVAIESGARTQAAGVVGAALVALLVVAAPGFTTNLPSSALAAVVIVAASSLISLGESLRILHASRLEFATLIVAFVGVMLLGVLQGIVVAVALAFVVFVFRAWRPYTAELVRVDRRKGYHDVDRHPEGRRIPGLVIARFDAPLFFANGGVFYRFVIDLVDAAPQPVKRVVVAAEPITGIDSTAAEDLTRLDDDLEGRGILLVFAEMKGPVKDRLARFGLSERFGPDRHFPSLGTAVSAYVRAEDVDFVDWTDAKGGKRDDTRGSE